MRAEMQEGGEVALGQDEKRQGEDAGSTNVHNHHPSPPRIPRTPRVTLGTSLDPSSPSSAGTFCCLPQLTAHLTTPYPQSWEGQGEL